MANIRVTCPNCGKELEIGAEYEGQEVECGECMKVFVARGPGPGRIRGTPSPTGSTPSSRRRSDDENDGFDRVRRRDEYDEYDYEPRRGREPRDSGGGAGGAAVASLVLGVIALLSSCCPFTGIGFGVLAIILGALGKNSPGSSGTGTAGIVLGALAFLISAGLTVFWLAAGGNRFGN